MDYVCKGNNFTYISSGGKAEGLDLYYFQLQKNIFTFSHTQLVCYALLKILLTDIIKKEHWMYFARILLKL